MTRPTVRACDAIPSRRVDRHRHHRARRGTRGARRAPRRLRGPRVRRSALQHRRPRARDCGLPPPWMPAATRRGFGGRHVPGGAIGTARASTIASTITSDGCDRDSSRPGASSRRTAACYLHIDPRESHYCKVLLDEVFGRECFLNEVVWAYDYGARTTTALAREARRHPRVRARSGASITSTSPTSIASRTWRRVCRRRERAARGKTAHRRLVAHDRADRLARAHRLSDAETARHPAPDRRRVVAPRRPGGRLVRRQRDHRCRGSRAGAGASCSSTIRRRRSR